MIDLFKKQNRNTILEFLQTVGVDPKVCSERRSGISWLDRDREVYAYSLDDEIVILMTDTDGTQSELADEEYFADERPMYFSECSHRPSPVWELAVIRRLLEREYQNMNSIPCRIWAVLLTTSTIINYADMVNCWDVMGVTVIDRMKCRKFLSFPTVVGLHDTSLLFFRMAYFDEDAVVQAEGELKKLLSDEGMTICPSVNLYDDDDFEEAMKDFVSRTGDTPKNSNTSEDDDNVPEDDETEQEEASPFDLCPYGLNANPQRPEPPLKAQVLKPLSHPRKELNRLVGCTDIKRNIDELMTLNRYNSMMQSLNPGAKVHALSLHGIFFGRPGTRRLSAKYMAVC